MSGDRSDAADRSASDAMVDVPREDGAGGGREDATARIERTERLDGGRDVVLRDADGGIGGVGVIRAGEHDDRVEMLYVRSDDEWREHAAELLSEHERLLDREVDPIELDRLDPTKALPTGHNELRDLSIPENRELWRERQAERAIDAIEVTQPPIAHVGDFDPKGRLEAYDPTGDAGDWSVPLWRDAPRPEDVEQGSLGDCTVAAAMSAIARRSPEDLDERVRDGPDGTVEVRLAGSRGARDEWIRVDRDLPTGARADGDDLLSEQELHCESGFVQWPSAVEKAIATRTVGGYAGLDCGMDTAGAKTLMQNLTGRETVVLSTETMDDSLLDGIRRASERGAPAIALLGTPSDTLHDEDGERLAKRDLQEQHAYSIDRIEGDRVYLRNPWGVRDPAADETGDSGVSLADLQLLRSYIVIARPR